MSGQLLRQFAYGGQKRTIVIAEQVIERGYNRLVSAIEPELKDATAKRIEDAIQGPTFLQGNLKESVVTARIV